ncbi:3-deoxy-D-manno-octulosonic acid transferase, partial [bacterium]|nr:3-deoxy-D-manno-octulosonic acid transferase [bacterium]
MFLLLIYNSLLPIALLLLSPIIIPIVLFTAKYRINFIPRLTFFDKKTKAALKALPKRPIFIHAVSVGEVGVAKRIIEALDDVHLPIVLSTITITGQEHAKDTLGPDVTTVYFPFDLSFIVRRFLRLVDPCCVIIAETELWPNFINEAAKVGIPLALCNGRISDKSIGRYRLIRPMIRKLLSMFSAILVQTEADRDRMLSLGAPLEILNVAGTVKFDVPQQQPSETEIAEAILDFGIGGQRAVVVAGSTHPGEEEILVTAFQELRRQHPNLAMIIAPRHVGRGAEIAKLAGERGIAFAQRSNGPGSGGPFDLLILDTIGELVKAYKIAQVAFVGKSLCDDAPGGQNPLEPASSGVPVVFGPNMQNFRQVAQVLLSSGAAIQVANGKELVDTLSKLLSSPDKRREMAQAAHNCFDKNRG